MNGVLRSLSREKEKLVWPDKEKEPVLWLSVMYSMPEWNCEDVARGLRPGDNGKNSGRAA